jgi:hypothetical protein
VHFLDPISGSREERVMKSGVSISLHVSTADAVESGIMPSGTPVIGIGDVDIFLGHNPSDRLFNLDRIISELSKLRDQVLSKEL